MTQQELDYEDRIRARLAPARVTSIVWEPWGDYYSDDPSKTGYQLTVDGVVFWRCTLEEPSIGQAFDNWVDDYCGSLPEAEEPQPEWVQRLLALDLATLRR